MLASPAYPRWIEGIEPNRWDMVFDRQRPSCYASAEFREVADEIGGNYVIAGRFGELSCLSTAIDAFHRDHRPTVLSDALMCRAHDDVPAAAMLRAVTCILSHYADTVQNAALDTRHLAESRSYQMTTFSTLHPLKYIAEALAQMATTLKDFEMQESSASREGQSRISTRSSVKSRKGGLRRNSDKRSVYG